MGVTAERPGEPVFAQPSDPRATSVGRLMRRTHLDELPQLWNILRGDMSIVGPRPERPEFIAMLEAEVPFWSRRLLMKPGLTGWAQVRCGYATDSESRRRSSPTTSGTCGTATWRSTSPSASGPWRWLEV